MLDKVRRLGFAADTGIWTLAALQDSYKLKTVNVKKLLHITKKYAKIFTLFFSSWIKSAKAGLIR